MGFNSDLFSRFSGLGSAFAFVSIASHGVEYQVIAAPGFGRNIRVLSAQSASSAAASSFLRMGASLLTGASQASSELFFGSNANNAFQRIFLAGWDLRPDTPLVGSTGFIPVPGSFMSVNIEYIILPS